MASETIITDPKTGAMKGRKLQRFSLIPRDFLWALAEHYGKGALKYTLPITDLEAFTRVAKTCEHHTATRIANIMREACVDHATKSSFAQLTQSTPNGSTSTQSSGPSEIGLENGQWIAFTTATHGTKTGALSVIAPELWQRLDLAWTTKQESSLIKVDAASAVAVQAGDGITWIMIMTPETLEVFYVGGATRASDFLAILQKLSNGLGFTLKGLSSQQNKIVASGDRNWEKGYAWSLSIDSVERHFNQYIEAVRRGDLAAKYDNHTAECPSNCTEHTGSHHLIAAAWHLIALYVFDVRDLGTNDLA